MTADLPSIDLVVFTCEDRGHLLAQTMHSFGAATAHPFRSRILAVDGRVAPEHLATVGADLTIARARRQGYVRSIMSALALIEANYFFWLEDDWCFREPIDVSALVAALDAHPEWTQIRLSKTGRLTDEERRHPLADGIYESVPGFSANPCLCRTSHVRAAFAELAAADHGSMPGVDGFENVLTRWCAERGFVCAVRDSEGVGHAGYLESTDRRWHMTASLDGATAGHVTMFAADAPSPPAWRRAWMVAKLARRFGRISLEQLRSDSAYELAFRMVTVPVEREARP